MEKKTRPGRMTRASIAAIVTVVAIFGVAIWLMGRRDQPDRSETSRTQTPDVVLVGTPGQPAPDTLPGAAEKQITISFAVWQEDRPVYAALKKEFEAANPGITVRLVALENRVRTLTRVSEGRHIEIQDPAFSIREITSAVDAAAVALPAEAMSKGYIHDLKPLMDADPQFNRPDFHTGTLEAYTEGESIYLLPSYLNVPLLLYNKEMWAEAGLGQARLDWTWPDLVSASERLARTSGDKVERYGMMGWGTGVDSLLAELSAEGADLNPMDGPRLDTPLLAAALGRVAGRARSGAVYIPSLPTPAPQTEDEPSPDERVELVKSGRVGLWSHTLLGEEKTKLPFAIGVLPSPSTPVFAEGYVMSSGTQHPRETWQWLSFLSRQHITWSHGNPFPVERVPARKSVAGSSGYWGKLDEETKGAIEAILNKAASAPLTVVNGRAFYVEALSDALIEVAGGEQTAEQALRAAQAEVDEYPLSPLAASSPTIVAAGPSPRAQATQGVTRGATAVPFATPIIDPSLSLDAFYEKAFMDLTLRNPELYTELGLPARYKPDFRHDTLTDVSDHYTRQTYGWAKAYLERLRGYDPSQQTPEQLISTDILAWHLDDVARGEEFMYHEYIVNPMFGVQNNMQDLMTNLHPLANKEQAEDYVNRLKGFRAKFEGVLESLRIREVQGIYPPRWMIERVLDQMREFRRVPIEENAINTSFRSRLGALDNVSDADKEALYSMVRQSIQEVVYPAYGDLIDYFEELEPDGRDTDGVWALPNGDAYYRYALRHHTTTEMTPQEVHDLGLAEVARIQGEMRGILDGLGYKGKSLREGMEEVTQLAGVYRLNSPDQKEQLLEAFRDLIGDAEQNLAGQFDIKPYAAVEVRAVPEYRQAGSPAGNYVQPSLDGSRPGVFYVNLGRPVMPKYQMPTLAYHEGVPGHHFQLALQVEADGLPLFRRAVSYPLFTAYIEGWGLYAEKLAAEAGFYKNDPYGELGRLQAELFRAARLAVDTGIHYKRWTREQAIVYMSESTASPQAAFAGEVERYIAWPGQACGYKVGELRILQLRERARAALGPSFDVKEFHSVVLQSGSMPLDILEQVVDQYIASKR